MKSWLFTLAVSSASSVVMAAQPQMSVEVKYDWYGWGSVSEHWLIQRDARGVVSRVQIADSQGGNARLPVLLSAGAMAAFETALEAPALTRQASVELIAARLDRPTMLALDPGLRRIPESSCTFPQQQEWARRALATQGLRWRVARHFDDTWTDDGPLMTMVVKRSGRPDVVLVSTSQKVMMLPWKRPPSPTFDHQVLARTPDEWRPALSEAVNALLPAGEASRRRFQIGWLQDQLRSDLARESLDCGARGRGSAG